jgi:hypothetical protein
MAGFRYSTPIIIPETSQVSDRDTQQELTYVFNALRTMAAHIDDVTGALSPLVSSWPQITPQSSILGNNINKFHCICGADIPYGAFVNFYSLGDGHNVQARPAQASGFAKAAAGFCLDPAGFLAGNWGEFVVGPGVNYGIGGMTPGNWYFLDPTSASGQVTAAQPTTPGQIVQLCGIAIKDNALLVGSLNNWSLL